MRAPGLRWPPLAGAPGWAPFYGLGLVSILGLLVYEHRVARSLDVAAINAAFFNANAGIGVVFLLTIILDRLA